MSYSLFNLIVFLELLLLVKTACDGAFLSAQKGGKNINKIEKSADK